MSRRLLTLRWFLLYLASRAGLLLPRRLVPTRFAYGVAVRVADVCYLLFRGPRSKLISNLELVLRDEQAARKAARNAFRQYAKYIIDLFQLPALGPAAVRSRTDFHAWGALDGVIEEGKGTIIVTLHFGQQETGAAALAASGYKVSVIAKTLEFSPINSLIQGFRSQMGMRVIPAENGRLGTFRCLARNEVIGMLVDMADPGDCMLVDFFGAKAEMSSAPARIALRTGARLVPAVVVRDPEDDTRFLPMMKPALTFETTGDEEADAAMLTQQVATAFEGFVASHPDQWFAFRPVWRDRAEKSARVEWHDRFNYLALDLANSLFRSLPKGASYAVARLAGDIAYYFRKGIRADVKDNMRHVLGPAASSAQVSSAARQVLRNVCLYYADLIRLPRISPRALLDQEMTVEGLDRVRRAMAGGRGAVVATAHFGNPEVAVQIAPLLGLDVLVLSEPLNPPAFSALVHRLRESHGIPYEEVGFKAIGRALAHLRKGGTLAITCDRDIQDTGAFLPFFGEKTRMPLGAAELAARTGAALVPAFCIRTRGGYRIVFEDEIEVPREGKNKRTSVVAAARKMIERMESWIAASPGQWMVLERVWKPLDGAGLGREAEGHDVTMALSKER